MDMMHLLQNMIRIRMNNRDSVDNGSYDGMDMNSTEIQRCSECVDIFTICDSLVY